eukprot:3353459-Pyramimonas_sp.AAC.1
MARPRLVRMNVILFVRPKPQCASADDLSSDVIRRFECAGDGGDHCGRFGGGGFQANGSRECSGG